LWKKTDPQGEKEMQALLIFYVSDQAKATDFYSKTLGMEPTLDVPGMTEFTLPDGTKIGFMPSANIKKLLGEGLPDPEQAAGTPRSEIYLMVDDPALYHDRAVENGATELQPLKMMNWGQKAAYSLDQDGHVLAFGELPDQSARNASD